MQIFYLYLESSATFCDSFLFAEKSELLVNKSEFCMLVYTRLCFPLSQKQCSGQLQVQCSSDTERLQALDVI